AFFRAREAESAREMLRRGRPSVIALGGGAPATETVRALLARQALTVLLEVDVDDAWARSKGGDRPLARDELHFRALHTKRAPLYREVADAVASDADDVVLAAGGVHLTPLERLGELVPGDGPVALVSDQHVAGLHGSAAERALGDRLASSHQLPRGEEAKTT